MFFWHSRQQIRIRWGVFVTEPFTATNGVKQGGILSFNISLFKVHLLVYVKCWC